jgi:hypothetical protein
MASPVEPGAAREAAPAIELYGATTGLSPGTDLRFAAHAGRLDGDHLTELGEEGSP